jgi:hypothetical protein
MAFHQDLSAEGGFVTCVQTAYSYRCREVDGSCHSVTEWYVNMVRDRSWEKCNTTWRRKEPLRLSLCLQRNTKQLRT